MNKVNFKKGDKIYFQDFKYNDFQNGTALNNWDDVCAFSIRLDDGSIAYINQDNQRNIKLTNLNSYLTSINNSLNK